jgi:hypothetical protein
MLDPDPLNTVPAALRQSGFIRRRCRNPRCGSKLKCETDKPRDAFCCAGCFDRYYRKICVVCERPVHSKAAQQRFCSNRCRSAFRRHTERFSSCFTPPCRGVADATRKALTSAHFTGLKTDAKHGRPWRVVAGSAAGLDPINLAIPLDPETAARSRRANQRYWAAAALSGPRDWPIDWIGGGDLEHELVRQRRKFKLKQEKTL